MCRLSPFGWPTSRSTCLARLAVIVLATAWLTDNCLDLVDLRRSDLALLIVVGVRPGQMARAKVSALFSFANPADRILDLLISEDFVCRIPDTRQSSRV